MWFNNNYCLKSHNPQCSIFSVPNEGKSAQEQMYKRSLGMKSGVADLIVLMPKKCIFIECKDEKGKQRPTQKEFEQVVTSLGFEYHVVRSLEDFKEIIKTKI